MKKVSCDILIFKAPSDEFEESDDPFIKILEDRGFKPINIPVLEFEYCDLNTLKQCLDSPNNYAGLIFTSPRAVKSVALSLGTKCKLPQEWFSCPAFVVGESTHQLLQDTLGLKGQGSASGNASNLADHILQSSYSKPLLFPCGNLTRGVLRDKLEVGGVLLHSVVAYRTQQHRDLRLHLLQVTEQGRQLPRFVVYFSPSGVKFTLPILQEMQMPLESLKFIAIGPATEAQLKACNIPVWSVAGDPTPESLVVALRCQPQQ